MRPLLFAHISDLHIGTEHRRLHTARARRLLERVARRGVDHVVLTGDITADAAPGDFAEARRLLESFGLLQPSRLSVVIGNHDVFGGVHLPEDILGFPRRCRETAYERKMEEFREHFREAFQNCFFTSPLHLFPYGKVIGNVLLVGMNTVAPHSRLGNPIGSNGAVDHEQFRRLQTLLGADIFQDRQKIVLSHHHFATLDDGQATEPHSLWNLIELQTMKLRGRNRLCRLLQAHGVQLVLHGHVHRNEGYRKRGIRFLNGGGSVLGPNADELCVNFVTIGDAGVEVEMERFPAEGTIRRHGGDPLPAVRQPAHIAA